MGDIKQQAKEFWDEAGEFLAKIGILLLYVSIGVAVKLAVDSRVAQLSRKQIVIKAILSISTGAIVTIVCYYLKTTMWVQAIIIPTSTYLGEGVWLYIMNNWESWVDRFVSMWFKSKDKSNGK